MPSFLIIKTPKQQIIPEEIASKARELSVMNSNKDYREGTLPESVRIIKDNVYFVFGFEYDFEYPTLEGIGKAKALGEVPIVFLGKSFLATGNATKEIQQRVKKFLENNFIPEIILEPIPLKEDMLRSVIQKNPDVFQVDHTPSRKGLETIDKISLVGRGVTHSQIWEDYGDQPLEKVKVRLTDIPEEAVVGFHMKGIITIYHTSLTAEQIVIVLRELVDRVVAPLMTEVSFQCRLV